MLSSRTLNTCAWTCLIGWAGFVWMEHKAKQREAELEQHAAGNGNGTLARTDDQVEEEALT